MVKVKIVCENFDKLVDGEEEEGQTFGEVLEMDFEEMVITLRDEVNYDNFIYNWYVNYSNNYYGEVELSLREVWLGEYEVRCGKVVIFKIVVLY